MVSHPLLQIQLFGGCSITYDGLQTSGLNKARIQSLLAYLILNAHIPQSRQRVAFLLWPDTSEANARNNLRQLLHQVRRYLPDPDRFLTINANSISWLDSTGQIIDVHRFQRALEEAETAEKRGDMTLAQGYFEEAIRLYQGDLLPDCYDDWIIPDRDRLRQACQAACKKLVSMYEGQHNYVGALRVAQLMLHLDTLDENTYVTLMRLHDLNNNRPAARRVYKEASETLRRELDVQPGEMLQRAYERVQSAPTRDYPVRSSDTLTLVGRQAEWQYLQAAWQRAASGNSHLVLVTGEAGIGKSRLAEELFTWANQQGFTAALTRSYAAEGRLSLAPVTEWLRNPALRPHLKKLDKLWLSEVARLLPELLSEDTRLTRPGPIGEYGQRQHFIEALARAILAAPRPALLWIDDLQWCDPDTLEWLHFLLRFEPHSSLLLLGTVRSEELPSDHPLVRLTLQLHAENRLTSFELKPLDAAETARLASQIQGKELDSVAATRLFHETEGNPLFIVETVRAGNTNNFSDGTPMEIASDHSSLTLPPRAHAVIAGRLSQLSAEARRVAELGASIGRAFSLDVLLIAGQDDESITIRALDELWQKRIVREQDPNVFDFTHDKLREVAYADISTPQRRLFHRRIAQALELLHTDDLDPASAQIAAQYEQAGLYEKALPFYQRAGSVAAGIYANEDAIDLLLHGLELLSNLPPGAKRDSQELNLQLALAALYRITKGWASQEEERVLYRAMLLSEKVGDLGQRIQTLFGLQTLYVVQARFEKVEQAHIQAEQLYSQKGDSTHPPFADIYLAGAKLSMGQIIEAKGLFEEITAVRDDKHIRDLQESQGLNYLVHGLAWNSLALWCLGYVQKAQDSARTAIECAREFAQPFNQALAITYSALLQEWCADPAVFLACAKDAYAQSAEYKAPYYRAWANILVRFAQAGAQPDTEHLMKLREAINAFTEAGARIRLPVYYSLLARACQRAGELDEGLEAVEKGFTESLKNGERWWDAELHRLRGEMMWSQGANENEAEAAYLRAIEVSQSQQAKSLELRATMSLGRLWCVTGRSQAAIELLAPLYAWFSEGLNTPDLRTARALIAQLQESPSTNAPDNT